VELVTILRELWRLRILVVLVTLVAVGTGYAVAYQVSFPPQSRSYTVGIATARILVDTPDSQVVEVAPKGSETLGARANVLANLMVDGELKAAIAERAGVRPNKLVAAAESAGGPEAVTPLTRSSLALTTGVVVNTDLAELPIIKVEAQAPDTQTAIALANAAVEGLSDYLDAKATTEEVSASRRLRVSGLGSAQGHEAARGPGRIMGLAVVIFLFVAGCAAILGLSAVIRGWRLAVALEQDLSPGGVTFAEFLDADPVEPSEHEVEAVEANQAAGARA
jgi:hypothetical protein